MFGHVFGLEHVHHVASLCAAHAKHMRVFLAHGQQHGAVAGIRMLVVKQGVDDAVAHVFVVFLFNDTARITALEVHVHKHVALRHSKRLAHVEHIVETFGFFVDIPVVFGLLGLVRAQARFLEGVGRVENGAKGRCAVVGAHAHDGFVAHDVHEAAKQTVFHFVDVALHLFGLGANSIVRAVQLAEPAVIEPVDGMGMHVEQIPIPIGLDERFNGVPQPCAVKVHQFAHGVGIDNAVQIGDQTDVVGRNVLGKINLRGGFGRGNKATAASNARDVQLEFFSIVRKLHELGAEHALFGAAIGLHGKVVLGGFAPLAKLDGKEGLGVVLFRAKGHAVIAVIAALPHKAVPGLVFKGFNGFLEVHTHVHFKGLVAFGQVGPAFGIVKGALNAHGVEICRNNAFRAQEFLVLIAVQGPAGFCGAEALAHDHHAVLHFGRPGHGVVDDNTLFASLVPRVPDGLCGQDAGAESLRGFLVIKAVAFVVVIVVFHAVGAGPCARADSGPGRRSDRRQIETFGDVAALLHELSEVIEPPLSQHYFKPFRNKAVVTYKGGALCFCSHD